MDDISRETIVLEADSQRGLLRVDVAVTMTGLNPTRSMVPPLLLSHHLLPGPYSVEPGSGHRCGPNGASVQREGVIPEMVNQSHPQNEGEANGEGETWDGRRDSVNMMSIGLIYGLPVVEGSDMFEEEYRLTDSVGT